MNYHDKESETKRELENLECKDKQALCRLIECKYLLVNKLKYQCPFYNHPEEYEEGATGEKRVNCRYWWVLSDMELEVFLGLRKKEKENDGRRNVNPSNGKETKEVL